MRAIYLVALVALPATVVRHWLSLPEALARALSHALGCSLPQQAAQSMRSRLGRYEAREEETLSAVAVRFRTTVGSLLQMNPDISDDVALTRNRSRQRERRHRAGQTAVVAPRVSSVGHCPRRGIRAACLRRTRMSDHPALSFGRSQDLTVGCTYVCTCRLSCCRVCICMYILTKVYICVYICVYMPTKLLPMSPRLDNKICIIPCATSAAPASSTLAE